MKKLLAILVIVLSILPVNAKQNYLDKQLKDVENNVEYQSISIHERNYTNQSHFPVRDESVIDPGLININANYEKVSDTDFEQKMKQEDSEYEKLFPENIKKNSNRNNVDYYAVYRIAERLIRANNLDYVNWRIAIKKTANNVNASSSNANFVCINTALYDSLYPDEDAMAFVMAHEMAHLILGHQQRNAEYALRLNELAKNTTKTAQENAPAAAAIAECQYKNIMKKIRMMEYMADSEALILMTKAGYSLDGALTALNFIAALPDVDSAYNSHPLAKDRIDSAVQNIEVLNPDWVDEGRANIYNNEILPCKKSSDSVSFVIIKSDKKKNFYHPETPQQRLTRMAYVSYITNKPHDAARYFKKLTKFRNDYVVYLYASYANEAYYKQVQKNKYHRRAVKAIKKANELQPNDINIKTQMEALGLTEKFQKTSEI